MTPREQQIVDLLRHDPLLNADTIAARIGSTRASVNVHLSNLGRKGVIRGRGYILNERPHVVVLGGAAMDVKARSRAPLVPGTSNPGVASMTPGGVGRNVAENLARLGTRTYLVAALGPDEVGDRVVDATRRAGVRVDHIWRTAERTGTYTAVLDEKGEMVLAVADMEATSDMTPEQVARTRDLVAQAGLLVIDSNLSTATIRFALDLASSAGVRVVVEPVSVPKARLLAPLIDGSSPVHTITPNLGELAALVDAEVRDDAELTAAVERLHDRGVDNVWVRLGSRGSLLSSRGEQQRFAAYPTEVVDVTGAGDSMLAAYCHALLEGLPLDRCVSYGHAAAALTVASPQTVRSDLTDQQLRSMSA